MTTRIFVTHCCKKKNQSLRNTTRRVTPDRLYTATPTKRFMQVCQDRRVKWAIFSDKYGVYFPDERHGYYEKSPSQVLEHEFVVLLESFDRKLRPFDEIWFYYPGRVNPLYRKLLSEARLRNRVKMFSHLKEIG